MNLFRFAFEMDSRTAGNHISLRGLPLSYAATKTLPGVGAVRGPMFRMPAYDPAAIAVMGCGIFLAAALAFSY
jgi:hypothetical protein